MQAYFSLDFAALLLLCGKSISRWSFLRLGSKIIPTLGKRTTKIDLLSQTHFTENFSKVLIENLLLNLTLESLPKHSTSRFKNYVLRTFRSAVGFLSFIWANEMCTKFSLEKAYGNNLTSYNFVFFNIAVWTVKYYQVITQAHPCRC